MTIICRLYKVYTVGRNLRPINIWYSKYSHCLQGFPLGECKQQLKLAPYEDFACPCSLKPHFGPIKWIILRFETSEKTHKHVARRHTWTLQGVPNGWDRVPLSHPLRFKHHPWEGAGSSTKCNRGNWTNMEKLYTILVIIFPIFIIYTCHSGACHSTARHYG